MPRKKVNPNPEIVVIKSKNRWAKRNKRQKHGLLKRLRRRTLRGKSSE